MGQVIDMKKYKRNKLKQEVVNSMGDMPFSNSELEFITDIMERYDVGEVESDIECEIKKFRASKEDTN